MRRSMNRKPKPEPEHEREDNWVLDADGRDPWLEWFTERVWQEKTASALEYLTRNRNRARRRASAYCPRHGKGGKGKGRLLAGVYPHDGEVWLWLEAERRGGSPRLKCLRPSTSAPTRKDTAARCSARWWSARAATCPAGSGTTAMTRWVPSHGEAVGTSACCLFRHRTASPSMGGTTEPARG